MEWWFWAKLGVSVSFFPLLVLFVLRFVKRRPAALDADVKLLVVAGSGGHTTEILRLLNSLSKKYSPRHYVLADSDKMSEEKIRSFEQKRAAKYPDSSEETIRKIMECAEMSKLTFEIREREDEQYYKELQFALHRIPRSREVRQSWSSSLLTTIHSLFYSLPLAFKLNPDVIRKSVPLFREAVLCNGPGTCVPICLSAFLLKILGLKKITIVYVESICRVENLSLSGKILYYFSDYFFVQWPALKEKYPNSLYFGRIV